jgi:hypothetical protein
MTRLIAAAFAAVLLGAAAMLISGLAPSEAHSTPVIVKGDRLDAKPYGAACSEKSWPYYEAGCLRNRVGATREAKVVRVVAARTTR